MMIDIKGHSGCNIDIIEDNDNLFVKKSTKDIKYLDRLCLQGKKQKEDKCLTGSIVNPSILDIERTDSEASILMPYIYAKNFIDYFPISILMNYNHDAGRIADELSEL